MSKTIKVRVPGTSANCGPGFDSIGLACSIYNDLELTLSPKEELIIEIFGFERGIPGRRKSLACVDYVPALCTHRPSLLPIGW